MSKSVVMIIGALVLVLMLIFYMQTLVVNQLHKEAATALPPPGATGGLGSPSGTTKILLAPAGRKH